MSLRPRKKKTKKKTKGFHYSPYDKKFDDFCLKIHFAKTYKELEDLSEKALSLGFTQPDMNELERKFEHRASEISGLEFASGKKAATAQKEKQIFKQVRDLQLTDAEDLAELLDSIARMYRYIGADWDIDLGEVLHWPSKAAKGIHAIELIEEAH